MYRITKILYREKRGFFSTSLVVVPEICRCKLTSFRENETMKPTTLNPNKTAKSAMGFANQPTSVKQHIKKSKPAPQTKATTAMGFANQPSAVKKHIQQTS
ncbi:hypothetical protein AB833_17215 [Chromatiales bacterium (ex Bugula neritina AB1)]|nr:hypothetical protein AB833_17215 [Chromatiales bacterium (ex Bugula neritina AB1)]